LKAGQLVHVKRISRSQIPKWPAEVKVGSVVAKIYRSFTRGRDLFTVSYRDSNHQRVKKSFADFITAKLEAQAAATINKMPSIQAPVFQDRSHWRVVGSQLARTMATAGLGHISEPPDTSHGCSFHT
jgi:hypothetical protein